MELRTLLVSLSWVVVSAAAHASGSAAEAADTSKPAAATAAAQAASAPAETTAAAPADADRKICRTERAVGSLIPSRVCKTAAQWEAEREQSRKMLQDMQQRTGSTYGR